MASVLCWELCVAHTTMLDLLTSWDGHYGTRHAHQVGLMMPIMGPMQMIMATWLIKYKLLMGGKNHICPSNLASDHSCCQLSMLQAA